MNHPDHKAIYSRIMTWLTIVVVYSSLFISLFGFEITKVLSKETIYWDAYKIIPILSLGIVFGMLKDNSVMGLHITKRTSIIGTILVGIATLDLGLNLILIPLFGVYGGAFSSLLSQIIYFIILNYFAQKYYHIPYRIDRVMIIIFIGVILYLIGSQSNNYSFNVRLLVKSSVLIIYPIFLFAFRVFDKSEIVAFKSFMANFKNYFGTTTPKDNEEQQTKVENAE
jgi:O-antigen/teichoic acid export membrane protein